MTYNLFLNFKSHLIELFALCFGHKSFFTCDAPEVWQLKLQDPSSSIMEGILMFNKHLLFIIIVIVVLVGWLLINTIHTFENSSNYKPAQFFHSNPLEIVWRMEPAYSSPEP